MLAPTGEHLGHIDQHDLNEASVWGTVADRGRLETSICGAVDNAMTATPMAPALMADGTQRVEAFDERAGGQRCQCAAEAADEQQAADAMSCSTGGTPLLVVKVLLILNRIPEVITATTRVDGCSRDRGDLPVLR